jgi:Helix-turn-helix domain
MSTQSSPAPAPAPPAPLAPIDPLRRYPVELALRYLETSRGTFYKLAREGKLHIVKEGRRSYVPASEIIRLSSVPQS